MLNECLMHEIFKMPLCKEEKGDGIELSLELSIGGNYGKFDGKNDEGLNNNDHGVSRFDFSCEKQENGGGIWDLQRKREIQALRRQEARKKREEKLQKSRGVLNNGGDFVNDKLILEAQKFQTRAEDREIKENDGVSEELCRKKEKNGVKEVENDLNLSLFSEKKQAKVNGFAYPWGLNAYSGAYLNVNNGNNGNYGSGVSSIDSGFSYGKNEGGNCSVERSSSVASDYQGTSHRGEINSDAGSHSSIPHPLQNPLAPRTKNTFELLEGNESSSQTEKVPSLSAAQGSNFTKFAPKLDTSCSTSENRTSPTSGRLTERPPKPPMKNDNATSLPHMPCVSATGNGPNGKTIRGFLYKYTKSEVSIMCACHGSSFSPAGFVEHAGCTNVSHPLKHITIIPSTLTYRIH